MPDLNDIFTAARHCRATSAPALTPEVLRRWKYLPEDNPQTACIHLAAPEFTTGKRGNGSGTESGKKAMEQEIEGNEYRHNNYRRQPIEEAHGKGHVD